MDQNFERRYFLAERNHPWSVARRATITELLRDIPPNAPILDIGCAGGELLKALSHWNVTGIDNSPRAIKMCRKKGLSNIVLMDAAKPAFPPNSFDVIIASDILEHLKDDRTALVNWNTILKPHGKLICFVPAFSLLWSYHDDVNSHYRRYTKQQLSQRMIGSGFQILRSTYWNMMALPPVAARNFILQHILQRQSDNLQATSTIILRLLQAALTAEHALLRYTNLPFGLSVLVIAQKKKK